MTRIQEFRKAYKKALDCSNKLIGALEKLSVIASDLYGQELNANICNGSEIEFRTECDPDGLHSISLRAEDVIFISSKADGNLTESSASLTDV